MADPKGAFEDWAHCCCCQCFSYACTCPVSVGTLQTGLGSGKETGTEAKTGPAPASPALSFCSASALPGLPTNTHQQQQRQQAWTHACHSHLHPHSHLHSANNNPGLTHATGNVHDHDHALLHRHNHAHTSSAEEEDCRCCAPADLHAPCSAIHALATSDQASHDHTHFHPHPHHPHHHPHSHYHHHHHEPIPQHLSSDCGVRLTTDVPEASAELIRNPITQNGSHEEISHMNLGSQKHSNSPPVLNAITSTSEGLETGLKSSIDPNTILSCLWLSCEYDTSSASDLALHLHAQHLAPLPSSAPTSPPLSSLSTQGSSFHSTPTSSSTSLPSVENKAGQEEIRQDAQIEASCQWDDCKDFEQGDSLARHFIETHLQSLYGDGMPRSIASELPTSAVGQVSRPKRKPSDRHQPYAKWSEPRMTEIQKSVEVFPRLMRCHWADCQFTFVDATDLMSHVSEVHVGSGKSTYQCLWGNCQQSEQGHEFRSRQKIVRHSKCLSLDCVGGSDRPLSPIACWLETLQMSSLQQMVFRAHYPKEPFGVNNIQIVPLNRC